MHLGQKMRATAKIKTKGDEAGRQPRGPAFQIGLERSRQGTGFGKEGGGIVVPFHGRIKGIW